MEGHPLQNRVLPDQSIVALPVRGTLTGNRGILHDAAGRLRRRWTSKAWICCSLSWKEVRRVPMSPGTWTELFFLDEATALAAGHRPCAFCRRTAFTAFRAAWTSAGLPGTTAPALDAHLHASRLTADRQQQRHTARAESLPDGTFILQAMPQLILGALAFPFTPAGYLSPIPRPTGPVQVMTPAPSVAALSAGYRPLLHPSAR